MLLQTYWPRRDTRGCPSVQLSKGHIHTGLFPVSSPEHDPPQRSTMERDMVAVRKPRN